VPSVLLKSIGKTGEFTSSNGLKRYVLSPVAAKRSMTPLTTRELVREAFAWWPRSPCPFNFARTRPYQVRAAGS